MTFYFFDLETSGLDPRQDRIMQFAGQRTDMKLQPVGRPDNLLVKMTADVLPEPGAVLVHAITPQRTLVDGISEAQFCRFFTSQVARPDTIAVGYNNVRFDNEFIRFTLWRNFYDAYEWSWKNSCSTWDLLDLVRLTRALRPDGINWPFAPDGKPSNKLVDLSAVNHLEHTSAHDALSDVQAAISLARLIKSQQPKLFDFLLSHRTKDKVMPLVKGGQPIVYSSGRYPAEFNRTTVAVMIVENADTTGALMYDLRLDPSEFSNLSVGELSQRWQAWGEDQPYFPIKMLRYNRCPAIAPLSVLDRFDGYKKLQLHKEMIENHLVKLRADEGFGDKLLRALELVWPPRPVQIIADRLKVDSQLYDGFINDQDKTIMSAVRASDSKDIAKLKISFKDGRLQQLLPLYKARHYPQHLTQSEKLDWQAFRAGKLINSGRAEKYFKTLEEIGQTPGLSAEKRYVLEDLKLYAQSIVPKVTAV